MRLPAVQGTLVLPRNALRVGQGGNLKVQAQLSCRYPVLGHAYPSTRGHCLVLDE